jgi:hypothetical protein
MSARRLVRSAAFALVFGIGATAWVAPAFVRAQDEQSRRVWDTEFRQKRQAATKTPTSVPSPSPVYKRVSPNAAVAEKDSAEVLGITIWRLRPSSAVDAKDTRLLIAEDDTTATGEWTPVRVEADTTFSQGERVRLSIESPRNGHLYVIDREQYDDGTTSDPYLIFPTMRIRGGDSSVQAGKVVELPERSAFRLKPLRLGYRGELLTLLVSTAPLRDLTPGPSARRLDRGLVEQWERDWQTGSDRFEMIGGAGKVYTTGDKQAGVEGRLLTQEDELPQTLYRVSPRVDAPLLVSVLLRIAQ